MIVARRLLLLALLIGSVGCFGDSPPTSAKLPQPDPGEEPVSKRSDFNEEPMIKEPGGEPGLQSAEPDVAWDDGDQARKVLASRRKARIAELRAYAEAGEFPHNHEVDGERRPFLMDKHGRLCAVGYLIATSGVGEEFDYGFFQSTNGTARSYSGGGLYPSEEFRQRVEAKREVNTKAHAEISALFQQLKKQDNHVRIADVTDGPILAWIATSGLTQEECARIQPGYTYLSCDDCLPGSEARRVSFGQPTKEARAIAEADRERIQKHLRKVIGELETNTEPSLEIALERLREGGRS